MRLREESSKSLVYFFFSSSFSNSVLVASAYLGFQIIFFWDLFELGLGQNVTDTFEGKWLSFIRTYIYIEKKYLL